MGSPGSSLGEASIAFQRPLGMPTAECPVNDSIRAVLHLLMQAWCVQQIGDKSGEHLDSPRHRSLVSCDQHVAVKSE